MSGPSDNSGPIILIVPSNTDLVATRKPGTNIRVSTMLPKIGWPPSQPSPWYVKYCAQTNKDIANNKNMRKSVRVLKKIKKCTTEVSEPENFRVDLLCKQ